jgi:hypothetical protein
VFVQAPIPPPHLPLVGGHVVVGTFQRCENGILLGSAAQQDRHRFINLVSITTRNIRFTLQSKCSKLKMKILQDSYTHLTPTHALPCLTASMAYSTCVRNHTKAISGMHARNEQVSSSCTFLIIKGHVIHTYSLYLQQRENPTNSNKLCQAAHFEADCRAGAGIESRSYRKYAG